MDLINIIKVIAKLKKSYEIKTIPKSPEKHYLKKGGAQKPITYLIEGKKRTAYETDIYMDGAGLIESNNPNGSFKKTNAGFDILLYLVCCKLLEKGIVAYRKCPEGYYEVYDPGIEWRYGGEKLETLLDFETRPAVKKIDLQSNDQLRLMKEYQDKAMEAEKNNICLDENYQVPRLRRYLLVAANDKEKATKR